MPNLPAVVVLLAVGIAANGQRISVYSEFQRVGPDGQVVSADRGAASREILSPAVARNGWVTYRVAVEMPSSDPYLIYLAQNPDDSARLNFYQEIYERVGDEWVPGKVKLVEQPVRAALAAGQKVQTYLLDMFVPASTPVARFRVEIQLGVSDRWVVYPMEVRVREATVPAAAVPRGPLPPRDQRADSVVLQPLREYICGTPAPSAGLELDDISAFSDRNVRQDLLLAGVHEKTEPKDGVMGMLLKAGGWSTFKSFCSPEEGSSPLAPRGAEWWLRARTYLVQYLPVE